MHAGAYPARSVRFDSVRQFSARIEHTPPRLAAKDFLLFTDTTARECSRGRAARSREEGFLAIKERRRSVRLKTVTPVEVITGLAGWLGPQLIKGNCLDLSVHGTKLLLSEKLAPGDEVLVLFLLRPRTIEVAAKVRRVEPTSKIGRWRVAFEFQGVSSLTFKLLDQFILCQLRSRVSLSA